MATVEQLTIQFEGKGAPKLTKQLNALSAAMNRLAGKQIEAARATKGASKATDSYNDRLTKNGRNVEGLTGAFGRFGKRMSQMRSQLLIVAFAFGVVAKAISSLNKLVTDFQKAQGKINAILKSTTGAAGKTSQELTEMADTYQKTFAISNTVIMEMQSRLLTFTNITGSQFDRTAKAALNLSTVFGQDLNQATIQVGKAINDPIKGYTALRRIGVSFSAQQVKLIKQFQEQGDVISAQNVILKELERELGNAAEASLQGAYANTQWQRAMNNLADAGRELGNILQPVLYLLAGTVNLIAVGFKKVLSPASRLGEHLGLVVKHWTNFRDMVFKSGDDIRIMEEMDNQISTASSSISVLFDDFKSLDHEFRAMAKSSEAFTPFNELKELRQEAQKFLKEGNIDKSREAFNKYMEAVLNNTAVVNNAATAQDALKESQKKSEETLKIQAELLEARLNKGKALTTAETLQIKLQRDLTEKEWKYAQSIDATNSKLKDREAINQKSIQFASDLASSFLDSSNTQMKAVKDQQSFELEQLRNSRKYQHASDRQKQKLEKEVMDRNQKDMEKAFNRNKNARYAQVIIDTYSGIQKAYSDHVYPASAIIASMIGVMGFANAAKIKSQEAPKFAYGGIVGGNRHSQGGTMIEAERGEYVVSRAGVEATGIEALNRINTGKGVGGVNITFQGNVMSKDFIEDEAIPQIKEAIRRGADIGVG